MAQSQPPKAPSKLSVFEDETPTVRIAVPTPADDSDEAMSDTVPRTTWDELAKARRDRKRNGKP